MTNKVLLFQLAFRAVQDTWITDSGGIWCIPFQQTYTPVDSDLIDELPVKTYYNVISVSYNGIDLVQVTSYTDTIDGRATALAAEPSFIWDNTNKNLYIRLSDYDDPRFWTVFIGVAEHISTQSFDDAANRLLYREDIKNSPSLSEEKDPLFFQKISFDTFSVTINNAGRKYDYLTDNRIFGQVGQYFWGEEGAAFSTFDQVKEAKVQTYQFRNDDVILRLVDSRASLSKTVPTNTLNQTDYTDLKDEFIGTPKPLVYGQVKDLLCIPLDDNTTQTNYTFMIADTEFHNIKSTGYTVYMDGTDKTAQVLNFSASAGTFQLPAAHYDIGKDVTFTGGGYVVGAAVIENPLDIIKDLMTNYLDIAYSSTQFNTTEWEATEALLDNYAIAIQERISVIGVIEKISSGSGAGFLLERDGKYTARYFDADANPVLTIHENQWLEDPIVIGDETELLTSATVEYNQSINKDTFEAYTDATKEETVYSEFGLYRDRVFTTGYSTATGAQNFAESIMLRSDDIALTISGTVSEKYIDLTEVKIGLIAQIEVNRQTSCCAWSEWLGKMRCEILGVYPDLSNRTVELKLRKIESVDQFKLSRYRITEDGNYRITEDGNFRITEAMNG
jgi:hypothetical protein